MMSNRRMADEHDIESPDAKRNRTLGAPFHLGRLGADCRGRSALGGAGGGTPERPRQAGADRRGDRGLSESGRAESERSGGAMEAAPVASIQRRVRRDFDRREKTNL